MSVEIKYNNETKGTLPINKRAILSTDGQYADYNIILIDTTEVYKGDIIRAIPEEELSLLYNWSEIQ